jgi:penicillin-binding protein 1A
MTDLLQSAVLTGTGRAAQIGRPVAGKTGTTSSNKDGWFIGFSSGLTTGVWMGRDDAKPVPGLQGGTAPARAFHDFMSVAVANRPVQPFETQVPMPDWQLTPEEEMYGDQVPDMNDIGPMMVDENGMPIAAPPPGMGFPQQQPMVQPDGSGVPTQQELDQAFPPQPQQQPRQPQQPAVRRPPGFVPPMQPRQPPPRQPTGPTEPQAGSSPQADAPEARSYTP